MNDRKKIILEAIMKKPHNILKLMQMIETENPNIVHAYISKLREDGISVIYNAGTKEYSLNAKIGKRPLQIFGENKPIRMKIPVYDIVDIEEFSKPKSIEDVVLMIQDIHAGAKTISYDIDKVPERIGNLTDNSLDVLSLISSGVEVENIHIFFLGDILNGEGVYPTQWYHSSATVTEQLRTTVTVFATLIRILSEYVKGEVTVCGVRGNHGRTGRYNAEESNYDIFFYDLLHLACKDYAKFEITKDFYMFKEIRGHKYLLTHGDQIKMYQGIPFYGIIQAGMKWQGSLGHFDVMCLGHYHTACSGHWNDFEFLMGGTALTDDPYTLEKLKMDSVPKMWMFGVSDKRPITWRFLIDVAQ